LPAAGPGALKNAFFMIARSAKLTALSPFRSAFSSVPKNTPRPHRPALDAERYGVDAVNVMVTNSPLPALEASTGAGPCHARPPSRKSPPDA